MKEVLLDFIPIRGSYTGEALAAVVITLLLEKGLMKRLLSVTCNNASNNLTIVVALSRMLGKVGVN